MESHCCQVDIGMSMGVTLSSFYVKVFYVMVKVLGGLSCMRTGLVIEVYDTLLSA